MKQRQTPGTAKEPNLEPVVVTTVLRLRLAMCAREIGSWQIIHEELGVSDRYCRQINEEFRTGDCRWRPIHFKTNRYTTAVAIDEYNRAVKLALSMRRRYSYSGEIIKQPLTKVGLDTVQGYDQSSPSIRYDTIWYY